VRDVYVDVRNIFDPTVPGENFWLFRLANVLHIETRAAVIRRELLMRPGDQTDTEQIEESERNLRALPFIKDATITPQPMRTVPSICTSKTQDSWTTQPQFNVASEGGQSTYSAGFEEITSWIRERFFVFYKKTVDGVTHQWGTTTHSS